MTLWLCSDCLQWREPTDSSCAVCGRMLDMDLPDPTLDELAERLGDLRECLGEVDLPRSELPTRGLLHATSNGLLFVPHQSAVSSFEDDDPPPRPTAWQEWLSVVRSPVACLRNWLKWDCRSWRWRKNAHRLELAEQHRVVLADVLMSDPGVLFIARASIANWRRRRRRWQFLHVNGRWLPEQFTPVDRMSHRNLQTWWETTACPLRPTSH